MHFSILVPHNVDTTKLEGLYQGALDQAASIEVADGIEGIGAKITKEYLGSMVNDFSVSVDDDINRIMDAYCEENDVEFDDQTDDLKASYETDTIDVFEVNGKLYSRYDKKMSMFVVGDDGIVREKVNPDDWKDSRVYLSPKAQKVVAKTVPAKEFYKTFKKYASERANYDEETKRWGYWCNPYSFYDWFSIGGRWQDLFLVKDTCPEYYGGVPGVGGYEEKPAPAGYRWCSSCRLKDLELDALLKYQTDVTTKRYNECAEIYNIFMTQGEEAAKAKLEEYDYPGYYSVNDKGIFSFNHTVYDPNVSLESILAEKCQDKWQYLASQFYSILDSAESPEDFPYFTHEGMSTQEWADQIRDIVEDYGEDVVITTVDCHE